MTTTPVPDRFQDLLETVVLGNTLQQWVIAIGAAIGAWLVLATVRTWVKHRVGPRLAERSQRFAVFVGRLMQRTSWLLVFAVSFWFGARFLDQSDGVVLLLRIAIVLAAAVQVVIWGMEAVEFGLESFLRRHRDQAGADDVALATAAPAMQFLGRLVVIVTVVLLALQNLGVDVTALIAGLGVGGIAIALAVQNVLGDLFGSLSIVLDKPFVVGDFIVVGDKAGTVEKIGLKTTRIRSLSGEQLIFANSDLLGSRIQNFKRMRERRVQFRLGITYQTPMETVAALPAVLRECVEGHSNTRFDRAHFVGFGASSLDFETVYWVLDAAYNPYADVHQDICLAIGRRFEELGVAFAYPTQTLFLARQQQSRTGESEHVASA